MVVGWPDSAGTLKMKARGEVTLDIEGLRVCGQDGSLELVRLLQYEVREGREAVMPEFDRIIDSQNARHHAV